MKSKGQVNMEFLITVGMIFLILIIVLGFFLYRKSEVAETKEYFDLSSECTKISNSINKIYTSGEGAKVEFETNNLISIDDSIISITDSFKDETITCMHYSRSSSCTNLTGDILIENTGGRAMLKNA